MCVLRTLDAAFFVLHSALIVFLLFGWLWRPLRPANLAVILMTGFSWTALGACFGWGYCPCTDWHWQVRDALGYALPPRSYVKFLLDKALNTDLDPVLVDCVTVVGLAAALVASMVVNLREYRRRARKAAPPPC